MREKYIVTGALGHLSQNIIQQLKTLECDVWGLILPTQTAGDGDGVHYLHADVTDRNSLHAFFDRVADENTTVIHAAGCISIASRVSTQLRRVNVEGTRNVIAQCEAHGVKRLIYVSSVHALPELPRGQTIREVEHFDPALVRGGYAKTKAEASAAVLDAAHRGLDAVIVHPSGILGPGDSGSNHLIQLIRDYLRGALPAGVQGGYDFVDVRDVARGCILAAQRGARGACYILSNRYYSIGELFEYLRSQMGGARKICLPLWMAKAVLPAIAIHARCTGKRPLFTPYSLYTLSSNAQFSHEKADRELGYRTRPMQETIADTVAFLLGQGIAPTRNNRLKKLAYSHP